MEPENDKIRLSWSSLWCFSFFLSVRSPQTRKGDIRRRERTCRDRWKDRRTSLWVIYMLLSLWVVGWSSVRDSEWERTSPLYSSKVVRWRSKSFVLHFRLVSPSPLIDPKRGHERRKGQWCDRNTRKNSPNSLCSEGHSQGLWLIGG